MSSTVTIRDGQQTPKPHEDKLHQSTKAGILRNGVE